jgi:hypothetical protein
MKIPPEILNHVFNYIVSERDAEEFYRAVYTDGQDSHRNQNSFLLECERRRWEGEGIACLSSLPYTNNYKFDVARIAARQYDFSLANIDDLPTELLRMFDSVKYQWGLLKRCMQMLQHYYPTQDKLNQWIWKIEAKKRFEKAAQYLCALENLLAMDSPLEEFLEDFEGVVTKETFQEYKTRCAIEDGEAYWWQSDSDSE